MRASHKEFLAIRNKKISGPILRDRTAGRLRVVVLPGRVVLIHEAVARPARVASAATVAQAELLEPVRCAIDDTPRIVQRNARIRDHMVHAVATELSHELLVRSPSIDRYLLLLVLLVARRFSHSNPPQVVTSVNTTIQNSIINNYCQPKNLVDKCCFLCKN